VPDPPLNPKEWGYYWTLAQVGFEMVLPIGAGALLDNYLGWTPWGVVVGAVIGLTGGVLHLVVLMKQYDRDESSRRGREPR
jgi:F0F1-type ATP synthase assembly protein I